MTITTVSGSRLFSACAILVALFQLGSVSALAAGALDRLITLDIPPNTPLDDALIEWGTKADVTVMINSSVVDHLTTKGIHGTERAGAMLTILLRGSGLSYTAEDGRVRVAPIETLVRSSVREEQSASEEAPESILRDTATGSAASPDDLHESTSRAENAEPTASHKGLDVIVVTAQKRSEDLMNVPASITAISGERLESQQVTSLSDLASYVPGLTIQNGGSPGERVIVLRGLSTGFSPATTPPLVTTFIDDIPVGATGTNGIGVRPAQFGLDLMPYDLERVEVLEGPQSTLYGADAMGGIVKYVLAKPNLAEVQSRVGGDLEDIDRSNGVGGTARGSVDLPIVADRLGLRFSGYYQGNPGYIDNVGVGLKGANHSEESGGRAAILWKPAEYLTVDGNFIYQHIDANDQTAVTLDGTTLQPIYGRYSKSSYFLEPFKQTTMFASLTVNWNMNFATLTSASSWSRLSSSVFTDLPSFGPLLSVFGLGNPDALAASSVTDSVTKYVEEVRLTSPETHRIQWMLGGYFTREQPNEDYSLPTYTPAKVPLPYNLYITDGDNVFQEQAIFGNVTYKLTDRLDISGGARSAENRTYGCNYLAGLFNVPGTYCSSSPYQRNTNWMANTRFHLDQDTMVYVRVATGYRPGGGCPTCGSQVLETPNFYYSDSLTNYEGGLKGWFFDRRAQVDLSVFYIDWKKIQLSLISPAGADYTGNGGTASSSGVELATSFQISDELRLNATLAYTDAHLTEDIQSPSGSGGKDGDQLPESARWTGSLTANYVRPIAGRMSLLIGGGYRYRDKIFSQFASSSEPVPLGPQNIVDFYAGISKDKVTARIYAKNLFNNYSYSGLLYLANAQRPAVVPVQPRTIGFSLEYQF